MKLRTRLNSTLPVRTPVITFFMLIIAVTGLSQTRKPGEPADSTDNKPIGPASAAQKYFSDTELINQDGRAMRFYSDVLKGKVVVINVFFTTCASACPLVSRSLEKIQEAMGERLGKDVSVISITVDPDNDTPPRLKEYAQRFHARPGRIFLTGKKENVDFVLRKLGQYVADKNDHSTILIIGNEPTGLWKKAFGLSKSEDLIKVVEDTLNNK